MSARRRFCRSSLGSIVVVGAIALGACSSGGDADRAASSTTAAAPATSAAPAKAPAKATDVAPTTGITSTTTKPTTTTTKPTTTTTKPTTTTSTTTATTTAPPPTTEPPLPTERGDLVSGAVGARTKALQVALAVQKYDPGPTDGKFGLKTTQSIWAWQALHGVPRTGVVDAGMERTILARTPQPMLRPELGPTHTEVDLARQVLLVFQDGRPELITHVSTGSGRHYCDQGNCGTAITRPGSFTYQRRVQGWRHAPLGLLYNPIYFDGGIAVHGAPSVPNYPASHGCVRIPMHIAEYYPKLVANGEPIIVV